MNAERLIELYERVADAPDAVKRLRRFVLDLAVRGKLTELNSSDECAANLLQTVQKEKERLIASGEAKSQKQLKPISDALFELPDSWAWSQLGVITSYIQRGKSPKYASSNGKPVISQKCVQWGGLDLDAAKRITEESLETYEVIRFLRQGDLLWNSTGTGTIGRVIRIDTPAEKLVCDSHVTVLRCAIVDSEYIRIWLRSDHVYRHIEGSATGSTNQVELTAQYANNLAVPLPPLAEQHRIVAKVDELMALCDRLEATHNTCEATRDRLTTATLARLTASEIDEQALQSHARFALNTLPALTARPRNVDALRHAIVNFAVRGRLASEENLEGKAIDALRAISSNAEDVISKPRDFFSASDCNPLEPPFEIPSHWTWARFPEIGLFGRGKSKHRPRNDSALFLDGIHPMIQTGDVARSKGLIKTYSYKYNDFGLSQSAKWPKGTLCITIAANIADSGILSFDACFPDSVVGFVLAPEAGHPKYFEYFLRTAKASLLDFAPATAQKNINLKILRSVLIPYPPPPEQTRIVAKVDELMALCDRLEARLQQADDKRARLLEALLAEALAPAADEQTAA
ncbi:MAG: restriction endonuclease subunit S [Salinisphaera sp.]|jgi:type I restriction enzyme S subunit|nr:restriction endonuclease subunit S [Salinisphaera sp.]